MIRKCQILLGIAVLSGLMLIGSCSGEAVVKEGDTVEVEYTGTLDDGSVFDSNVDGDPLEFIVGDGSIIEGFDSAVVGMKVGESKTVTILPAEAYGEYDDSLVEVVDKSQMPNVTPEVGMQLSVTYTNGSTGTVTIIAMDDTTVTVDANPTLAGKTLTFEIKLLEITPNE